MSVRQMTLVWEHSRLGGVKLLLLLAVADHANDEGICYPSVERLAALIRRSERQTQLLLADILATRPRELIILEQGGHGKRWNKGHLFQVVVKARGRSVSDELRRKRQARKARGEENNTPSRGEENNTPGVKKSSPPGVKKSSPPGVRKITPKPSLTTITTTTTTTATTAAAAASVVSGWDWRSLTQASNLPRKRAEALAALAGSSPATWVGLYLKGLALARINSPALWATAAALEAAQAGEPFATMADLGPAGLARVLAWLARGGPLPDLGTQAEGAALAMRGHLLAKYKHPNELATAADKAANELGLSALVAQAAAADEPEPGQAAQPEPEAPAPLDAWQRLLANGLARELPAPALARLGRCRLLEDRGPAGLVVGVVSHHDWQWLQRQLSERLAQTHNVTLTRLEANA